MQVWWRRCAHAFQLYLYRREEFLEHYHKRSSVETTSSMIKAQFGSRIRSKTETARRNEVLWKILCHNLYCLISAFYELGIEADSWKAALKRTLWLFGRPFRILSNGQKEIVETGKQVPTNASKKPSNARARRLVLGHDSAWWNGWVVASLAIAAFAAVAVVVTTQIVVFLQKVETREAQADLEKYKADVAARVAEANEKAATAQLEQERLKAKLAWRNLSLDESSALEKALASRPGTVNLWYTAGDPEAMYLAIQYSHVFSSAHWHVLPASATLAGIVFGVAAPDASGTYAESLRTALVKAGIAFSIAPLPTWQSTTGATRNPNFPMLMIGSRQPTVFP